MAFLQYSTVIENALRLWAWAELVGPSVGFSILTLAVSSLIQTFDYRNYLILRMIQFDII